MRPTVSTGAISGNLPGASGPRSYYVALDLAPGELWRNSSSPGERKASVD